MFTNSFFNPPDFNYIHSNSKYQNITPPFNNLIIQQLSNFILYLFKGNQVLPADKFGKIATVSFYIAILSVVFKVPYIIVKTLFIITVSLNIIAFINYFIIYLSMSKESSN